MKKYILSLFAGLFIYMFSLSAQQGYKATYLLGGLSYKNGGNIMIGLDFPNNYYSSFDVSLNYYMKKSEKNILGGIAYKPCISKGVNSMFRGKIGGIIGTTSHTTIFGGVLGFEYIYSITPVVDFLWLSDGGYYHNSSEEWRFNSFVGFRLNF